MINVLQNTVQGVNYFTNPGNQFWGTFTGTYSGNFTGTFTGTFIGNGSGLTNLNASALATGTVPSGVFSGTYSQAVTFSNASNSFTGVGTGLTALNPAHIESGTFGNVVIYGNASGTSLGGSGSGQGINFYGAMFGTFFGTAGNSGSPVNFYGYGTFGINPSAASSFYGVFTGSETGAFIGDGSALTGINPANISSGNFGNVSIGGVSSVPNDTIIGTSDNPISFSGTFTGVGSGTSIFSGDGSGLTSLNGSNIDSGTVAATYLPVASSSAFGVVKVDGTTITAAAGVISSVATSINISGVAPGTFQTGTFLGNSSGTTLGSSTHPITFVGNGAGIGGILAAGIVPGAFASGTFTGGTFSGPSITSATLSGCTFAGVWSGTLQTNGNVTLSAGDLTVSVGNITATSGSFNGSGSGLTDLDASNITTGTLDNARIGAVSATVSFADWDTGNQVTLVFTNGVLTGYTPP